MNVERKESFSIRVTPKQFEKLVDLGFEPGSCNIMSWMIDQLSRHTSTHVKLGKVVCPLCEHEHFTFRGSLALKPGRVCNYCRGSSVNVVWDNND